MRKHLQKISKYRPSVFQGRFDFSAPANVSLTAEHPREQLIFRVLIGALIILTCSYLYFVSVSVLNVMARREALARATQLEGDIGTLGKEYFSLSQETTPQMGSEYGLVPVAKTTYVYRPGATAAATIRSNEI